MFTVAENDRTAGLVDFHQCDSQFAILIRSLLSESIEVTHS